MKPVSKEGYKFCQEVCIPCYQTNGNCVLKPAAFMDLAQEIAYWAAQELGFGYDTLHIHHTAWVLSRMHIHFHRPVSWRDAVKLYTWHKGANGLFFLRDFLLLNAEGERCISATSSWVVIDEQSRRMVRPEDLSHLMQLDYEVEDAIEAYVDQLQQLTEVLGRVREQAGRMTQDSEEMINLNRTLTGINTIYEMQLKSISQQVGTIDQINDQTRKMAQQIEELNGVYARMIEALTVNMPKATPGA